MGSAYTIYAYFNAEQIQGILNAIVMLVGSGGVDGNYLNIIRVAAMIGLFLAITYGFVKARGEEAAHYLIMVAIFYSTLFVPRVTVTIEEHGGAGGGAPVVVDNVPLGLAFFASTTSNIGHWLTQASETFFALPDSSLKLSQHGLMGGARALRESQSAAMPDPVLAQDMINFMRDCINPELVMSPASVDALMKSTNIWADLDVGVLNLVNPGRMVTLAGSAGAIQCDTAYTTTIGSRLAPAATSEFTRIARILSPEASAATANTILGSMLPASEALIMTASASTSDAIRQRMMINMMNDTSANMAQIMNDPSAAQSALGSAMAASSANSSYVVMARLARETLPLVRNSIELVVIGVFPIILLLIIIAGSRGGMVLRSYVMTLLWVNLWAPLYAIVNYVATMASAKSMKASLAGVDGVSISNAAALLNTTISAEAVAGLLSISVPMIALAIVKGGEVAMAGVTGNLTGPADRAAAKSGEQVGTGNVSLGNTSWGNHSTNNTAANSHSSSLKYSGGDWGEISTGWDTKTMRGDAANTPHASVSSPKFGNSGVGATHGKKVETGHDSSSGLDSNTTRENSAGLTAGKGATFTQGDASVASSAVSQALNKTFGGGTRFGNGDFASTAMGNTSTEANKLVASNSENISLGGGIGVNAAAGSKFSNPVKGSSGGKPVDKAADLIAAGVDPHKVKALENAPDSASYQASGRYGAEAKTTEGKVHSGESATSADKREQIAKNFDKVREAAESTLGSNATSGQKAALNTLLGQLSDKLDSSYQTNTKSSLSSKASEGDSRQSTNGVSVSSNKETVAQIAMQEAAREMGMREADMARAMVTNQGGFQDRVAAITGAMLAGTYTPANAPGSGMDGQAINPPRSVEGERNSGLQETNAARSVNDAKATVAGNGFRQEAVQDAKDKGVPAAGAEVNMKEAQEKLDGTKKDTEAGQARLNDTAPVNGGATRAARYAFNDNSGALRLASTALFGGAGDVAKSPEQLEKGFKQLAANDPEARAILRDIGTTRRSVTEKDISDLSARADAVQAKQSGRQSSVNEPMVAP